MRVMGARGQHRRSRPIGRSLPSTRLAFSRAGDSASTGTWDGEPGNYNRDNSEQNARLWSSLQ